MATISSIMDHAARRCSIGAVTSWATSQTTTALEMKDFLTETAEELLDRVELPDPITLDEVITGTGVATYTLPTAFKRLSRGSAAVYESTSTRRMCIPITSNGDWTYLQDIGSAAGNRYYRITGSEEAGFSISFYRALEVGSEVTVSYITKNWILAGATPASVWENDTDTLVLPEVVTRLGVVWRFRQKKGLPYDSFQADYEIRLSRMINDARGIRTVHMGGETDIGHPMRVPVPDFIPG